MTHSLNPNDYSAVIFDLDETITTLQIDWTKWHYEVGEIFRTFDPSFNKHLKGKYIHGFQNEYFRKYGEKLRDKVNKFIEEFESKNVIGY